MQQIAISSIITAIKTSPPSSILLSQHLNSKTHFPKPIISAKWGRKRSGSRKSRKLILDSIAFLASNLKILPEPFDSLAREFWITASSGGGGNGGKFWLRNGFGGGGGGEGRNPKGGKFGFWVPLTISSALALWVVLERERGRDSELHMWVLLVVSAFAVYCSKRGFKKEIKDWVLGFSCGAALMGLALRNNENLFKSIDEFRASLSRFVPIAKKRRARKWI